MPDLVAALRAHGVTSFAFDSLTMSIAPMPPKPVEPEPEDPDANLRNLLASAM